MMHPLIEDQGIIERYVRNELSPQECAAFEEHYFSCDECFQKLQLTERFVAGVRDAARRGLLAGEAPGKARAASRWLPAFGLSTAAALLLAVVAGWLYFIQIPRIRGRLGQSVAALRSEQKARAALEAQLRQPVQPESNVPLVILQAMRGGQAPPAEAVLPASAPRLILWIDAAPAGYHSYRLELYDAAGKLLQTADHLTRNNYGALAASLPAGHLQSGEFRVKLLGEKPPADSLLGAYELRIRRP